MNRIFHTRVVAILLVVFLALAIGYTVTIPPGEGVDEAAHFDYVRYVKEHKALPVQPMTREGGVEVWMGHHPPLYYVLGALAISWTDTSDFHVAFRPNPHFVWSENDGQNGWNVMMHFGQDEFPWHGSVLALHILRLMNVALASIAIYATYRATVLLFPNRDWVPLGVAAVVAFNPSFLYMTSTVHHDVLQATIFALAAWWTMRFLSKPEQASNVPLAGLLLAAAMLTKLSGVVLAAVFAFALLVRLVRERDWHRFLRRVLIIFGIASLAAGWWYLRNLRLYGDPLGWQMFLNIHSHMVRPGAYTWGIFTDEFLGQIGRTYWTGFGFMHITFPQISRVLWWLVGLAFIGFVFTAARGRLSLQKRWAEWAAAGVMLVLLFASFVRFSIATVGAGHGRYLFPASFAVAAVIVAGLNGLTAWRHTRTVSVTLALSLTAFAVWLPITRVLPKYAPAQAVREEELDEDVVRLDVQVATGVKLVGYTMNPKRITPGKTHELQLFWVAAGDPEERKDPKVRLELLNEGEETLADYTAWPVPSMSPDVWPEDMVYVSQASLSVPAVNLSGSAELAAVPIFQAPMGWDEGQRLLLDSIASIGGAEQAELPTVTNTRQEILGETIALQGYVLTPTVTSAGGVVLLDLYWRVLEQPQADYTTFVHLLNSQGELIAQLDRPAGGSGAPSSTWVAGQTLRDTYPLTIPEGTPPGTYDLRIGLYSWPSLERLPVTVAGESAGDIIDLTSVRVAK